MPTPRTTGGRSRFSGPLQQEGSPSWGWRRGPVGRAGVLGRRNLVGPGSRSGGTGWRFVAGAGLCIALLGGCGERSFVASVALDQNEPSGGSPAAGGSEMGGATGGTGDPQARPFLRVVGQQLMGRCDEPVSLRGINEMVVWSNEVDGQPWFDEMAALGSNAVRIVWTPEGTGEQIDRVVGNAIGAGLIPVLELHQPMFDGEELEIDDPTLADRVVGYWTSDDVLPVLLKYEHALILEFGEKMGDSFDVEFWVSRFEDMVVRFRTAGIRVPLIFDAPYGGIATEDFFSGAPRVLAADPLANSMFSIETWSGTPEEAVDRIRATHETGIPFYLAEFSGWMSGDTCPEVAMDVSALLSTLQELNVGWFAWSWGGVSNTTCGGDGALDMTTDGHVSGLVGWGLEVAQTDPNSIAKTGVKLPSLTWTECPIE